MIGLGLDNATWEELISVLVSTHSYKLTAWLEDRNGNVREELTPYVVGGSVTVDATQALPELPLGTQVHITNPQGVTRTAQVNLWDPGREVDLGSAVYLQRLFCADFEVWLPQAL